MRRFIKPLMDFQSWVIKHLYEFYTWLIISGVLSTALYYYEINHPLPLISHLMILLFMYYGSFKIIIR